MAPPTDNYWSAVHAQRIMLADQVDALDPTAWDSPSWCDGWRVRDVLGHLVHLAEASPHSMALDMMRNGIRPNMALSHCAVALGHQAVPDLTSRLRAAAGGRFHVIGTPRTVVLGEVVTHGSDLLRPLSLDVAISGEHLIPVLDAYRRFGRVAFGTKTIGTVRLVATDCDWAHGGGDEVKGRAIDLLLLLANRRQVLPALTGPGVERARG
jgi:uncharacterized protein (TIGR03083 family)